MYISIYKNLKSDIIFRIFFNFTKIAKLETIFCFKNVKYFVLSDSWNNTMHSHSTFTNSCIAISRPDFLLFLFWLIFYKYLCRTQYVHYCFHYWIKKLHSHQISMLSGKNALRFNLIYLYFFPGYVREVLRSFVIELCIF